jgi:hypothetical protein
VIPILEAIETGAWLTAEYSNGDDVISFRVRLTDFSKINLAAVDDSSALQFGIDSNVWRLSLDVVNTCKRELYYFCVDDRLTIVDQDGYEFPVFKDNHLRLYSAYAEQSGMKVFFSPMFPPKIKRSGAYPFELPEDADELFLAIKDGTLREA